MPTVEEINSGTAAQVGDSGQTAFASPLAMTAFNPNLSMAFGGVAGSQPGQAAPQSQAAPAATPSPPPAQPQQQMSNRDAYQAKLAATGMTPDQQRFVGALGPFIPGMGKFMGMK